MIYGQELILDLHDCDKATMDVDIQNFCEDLALLVDMQIEKFELWASESVEERDPKTFGISAVQFILTSNITVHVLPLLQGGSVYINLFSCKSFDAEAAVRFAKGWFVAKECRSQVVDRI
ncbi:MAG: S-adenosylmethionine decarboxylase [Nitrosopumilus sp.]